jgi:hypothetical protein
MLLKMCVLIALTVKGNAANLFGRDVLWKAAVLMTKPDTWSKCGCVIKYVDTCSRTTCSAFALALALGNGSPANAPCFKVVIIGAGLSLELGESRLESPSEIESCPVLPGDGASPSRSMPLCGFGSCFGSGLETSGKSFSSMRVMAARWEPASTAKTEFLAHLEAVERTRKPVTLSSLGPPPEP